MLGLDHWDYPPQLQISFAGVGQSPAAFWNGWKMNLGFDDLAIFLRVVREGSFVKAARSLGLPTSTVSRRVSALEQRLKVQLLRRTTRAISLTEDGRAFAARCGTAFEEIDLAASALADTGGRLRGTLRMTAPHFACNELFAPYMLDFAARHPELAIDLRLTNATPDLVEDGIDLAFQLSPLPEGRHIARRLWPVPYGIYASRILADRHPGCLTLTHPRDLAQLPCILTPPIAGWSFSSTDGGNACFIFTPRRPAATVDDLALGAAAVKRGLGIGYLPRGMMTAAVRDGSVTELTMNGWQTTGRELFALYPASRQLSPKVRAAIDFAVAGQHAQYP